MVFWRKKKNASEQEREEEEDKIVHPPGEPAIEPSIDDDDPKLDENTEHELEEKESELLEELDESPVPNHNKHEDLVEKAEFADDSNGGGWLSRLTSGLSKSTNKLTSGLTDLVTKKKLDQETLDGLEELLISADLGPKTAMKVVEDFAQDRFGKDISEEEVQEALAQSMTDILKPVAKTLNTDKPASGPHVILVCGVNGAGKTTTIGKLANQLKFKDGKKVMIAAADTFRAAAIEQLEVWAKRTSSPLIKKDVGADAASVAFEAYQAAKEQGIDVLMIDTAGRLQNKANLMEELAKIIRVLKKQDETLPHEVLLVLDSTTGQNAFSQVETFRDMVNVSGLIVTKLDGSAKGGVLVGLADQFGLPVYAIGVGEGIEDLQPFSPDAYAHSLLGLKD